MNFKYALEYTTAQYTIPVPFCCYFATQWIPISWRLSCGKNNNDNTL